MRKLRLLALISAATLLTAEFVIPSPARAESHFGSPRAITASAYSFAYGYGYGPEYYQFYYSSAAGGHYRDWGRHYSRDRSHWRSHDWHRDFRHRRFGHDQGFYSHRFGGHGYGVDRYAEHCHGERSFNRHYGF